jgi:hypothetical protein
MDAYPMYETCVRLQQKYAWPISDLMEPSHIPGMIMLDSGDGRGPTAIMAIKYCEDAMYEHAKAQMDAGNREMTEEERLDIHYDDV